MVTLLIQRRVFKSIFKDLHMDGLLAIEKKLHIPFEELTENTAHLFFLLLAVVCFTLSNKKKPGEGLSRKERSACVYEVECDGKPAARKVSLQAQI